MKVNSALGQVNRVKQQAKIFAELGPTLLATAPLVAAPSLGAKRRLILGRLLDDAGTASGRDRKARNGGGLGGSGDRGSRGGRQG